MSNERVVKQVINDEVIVESQPSSVPTLLVFATSIVVSLTTLYYALFDKSPPMGTTGVLLVFAVLGGASFVYWRRTYSMRYVMTNRLFASFMGDPDEGVIKLIDVASLSEISYIYTSRSFFAKILSWLYITDYADICFCEAINTPPKVIFHNQADPEDIVKLINKELST